MDTERLQLKRGEKVTAAHVAQLDRTIARNRTLPGVRAMRRQYPWGTSFVVRGQAGEGDSPIFRPEVSLSDEAAEVRWSGPRALIGGVAPQLSATPGAGPVKTDPEIFDETAGERPALRVTREEFSAAGECGIYFRVATGKDFRALTVTPIASPVLPPKAPYTAHKLALFLRIRDGAMSYLEDADRELFCGQGFIAVNQRSSGIFEALFWATF